MKLGINIRNWGPTATPQFLRACAEIVDSSTMDSVWFNDHLGIPPKNTDENFPGPDKFETLLEPLGFAHYLAACTERIAFGTAVLVLPYRPKILTAKLLATIQILSGDRFLLGIGPGYLAEEFKALGVARTERGKITDETLAFLHEASQSELIEANGQPLLLEPKLSRPPILVGGGPKIATSRAIKYGDGWIPAGITAAELKPQIADFQARAVAAGRGKLEVVAMKTLPLEEPQAAIDMAAEFKGAGATHFVHTQGYDSPSHYAEIIEQIDTSIRSSI